MLVDLTCYKQSPVGIQTLRSFYSATVRRTITRIQTSYTWRHATFEMSFWHCRKHVLYMDDSVECYMSVVVILRSYQLSTWKDWRVSRVRQSTWRVCRRSGCSWTTACIVKRRALVGHDYTNATRYACNVLMIDLSMKKYVKHSFIYSVLRRYGQRNLNVPAFQSTTLFITISLLSVQYLNMRALFGTLVLQKNKRSLLKMCSGVHYK